LRRAGDGAGPAAPGTADGVVAHPPPRAVADRARRDRGRGGRPPRLPLPVRRATGAGGPGGPSRLPALAAFAVLGDGHGNGLGPGAVLRRADRPGRERLAITPVAGEPAGRPARVSELDSTGPTAVPRYRPDRRPGRPRPARRAQAPAPPAGLQRHVLR